MHEAQWVVTYECGLNKASKYCSLGEHTRKEASLAEKLEAISLLSLIGIRRLKFLGGEFFDLDEAEQLVLAANSSNFDFVVTTNGMQADKIMAIANRVGFKPRSGLFFSLDFLSDEYSVGGCSHVKTLQAKNLIPKLVGIVPLLGVNTVIHARNLDELPNILAWITDLGGFMNVCPLIWGDWGKFIYRTADQELALKPKHYSQVEDTMAILLAMKRQGYNLACSEEYITKLAKVCCCDRRFGWDCGHLTFCPLLRIDSDLSLMVCSDIRGAIVPRFKLQDLVDAAQYAIFQQAWLDDEHRQYCCGHFGCYWSNIVRARDNFDEGGSFLK
ncbi:MAG: hypothetical protein PHN39_02790 [Candidatus Pacebacteria bacterium]|nr:hypothetical protein [Candidatus Paceibacterota bacterium]